MKGGGGERRSLRDTHRYTFFLSSPLFEFVGHFIILTLFFFCQVRRRLKLEGGCVFFLSHTISRLFFFFYDFSFRPSIGFPFQKEQIQVHSTSPFKPFIYVKKK